MQSVSQAQSFGDIRIDGQANSLTINQIIQIAVAEVKTRAFVASSPYLGLRRFEERNQDFFFGRDQLVGQLLQLVAKRNLVLVAGASGSGKSSVVRAGLLPQLGARLPQGRFQSLVMTPDRDPFSSLRGALQGAGVAQGQLDALESQRADSIFQTLTAQRPPDDLWLLFIDQFEEIFTRCADPGQREAFLSGLTKLAQAQQTELKIVLAMRADFFDHFDPYPEFGALAQQGIQLVLGMQASELRAAIEQPAARHGVVFEDGLSEQIIADVKGRPGTLPLLQYTLDLLWRADNPADDRTLNTKSYHQIGGVEGALRQRADTIYHFADVRRRTARSPAQQEAMRQIFLRVVDLTSQSTEARAVSRRASLDDFPHAEERHLISELVDEKLLVSNSLLLTDKGLPNRSVTIEIAHEALLSAWPQLKGWIEQAREVIYVRNRLSVDARHFAQVKARTPTHANDELWGGTRLAQALELRARGDFDTVLGGLTVDEATFLDASARKKEAELAAKAEAEQKLKDAHEQLRQRLLDTYVEQGRQLLFEKQSPAEALLWLHRAQADRSTHPSLLYWLKSALQNLSVVHTVLAGHGDSVRSVTYSPSGRHILTVSGDRVARVWEAVSGRPITELKGHKDEINSAIFSPDGRRIVTASDDKIAYVWEMETGRLIAVLTGHENKVESAMYSPDGKLIVTASSDHTARVWDAEIGNLLLELKGHEYTVWSAIFSPDGRRIATASYDNTARLWETKTGLLIAQLKGHKDSVRCAIFSPCGHHILTASGDNTAGMWEAETGRLIFQLKGHKSSVGSAAFSPDGRYVVTASHDGTARIWKADTGLPVSLLEGHSDYISSVTFSPDGALIVTASNDKTARVWETASGYMLAELKAHEANVSCATFSPKGCRIVTASWDKTARVWELAARRSVAALKSNGHRIRSAMYSPDDRYIVTASADKVAQVWEAKSGNLVTELKGHTDDVLSAMYSPDSRRIVTSSRDWTAREWEAETGRLIVELKGHGDGIFDAMYSPGGRRIATASDDSTARIWETETGYLVAVLKGHEAQVRCAAFSPDGHRIVTASWDRTARVWDVETGQPLVELRGLRIPVSSATFSPDGRCIVTPSHDGTRVWEAETGRLITQLQGRQHYVTRAYSPDGRCIITASSNRTARVYEADTGHLIAELGHEHGVSSATYSPNGRFIVTTSEDKTVRAWDAKTMRLVAELKGHMASVNSVTFSPHSHRLLTVSDDNTARIWDLSEETRTASEIAKFIRCYVPFRFEREDSDVLVPTVPDPTECQGSASPAPVS